METKQEDQQKLWIVAVSGGSDSMALLQLCIMNHLPIVAAHMNYQKRATAKRDMEGVRAFCAEHQIRLEIRLQNEPCTGNFQAFARRQRYAFFEALALKYHAAGVLVAHQLDDHLETYLMQQEKGVLADTFGLARERTIGTLRVVRPLLDFTKAQLEAFCHKQQVPFWVDESNLADDYTRNRIRHTQIESMSMEDKQRLATEIAARNQQLHQNRLKAKQFLASWAQDCATLRQRSEEEQLMILDQWLFDSAGVHLSQKQLHALQKLIMQSGNANFPFGHEVMVRKEYGQLVILDQKAKSYAYTLSRLQRLETPYFRLSDQGATIEGITVNAADFPLTIRNAQVGDAIRLRFGVKRVSRWLIDRKIPLAARRSWPVVVNAAGNIIFVAKIGCDIAHFSNNPNVFVLK